MCVNAFDLDAKVLAVSSLYGSYDSRTDALSSGRAYDTSLRFGRHSNPTSGALAVASLTWAPPNLLKACSLPINGQRMDELSRVHRVPCVFGSQATALVNIQPASSDLTLHL